MTPFALGALLLLGGLSINLMILLGLLGYLVHSGIFKYFPRWLRFVIGLSTFFGSSLFLVGYFLIKTH